MVVKQAFGLGLGCIVAGVVIALFPSNYEIVGMDDGGLDSSFQHESE